MYERFTDRARKVIQLANQEAQRFNHEFIATEHILLGLVKEGSGVAANVLKNLGVDLPKIRQAVELVVQPGPRTDNALGGKLPHTPRARKVVDYAIEEARHLNHNYVGTEHLLLGLIREHDGTAAKVLTNLGLTRDRVREEVLRLIGHAPALERATPVLPPIDQGPTEPMAEAPAAAPPPPGPKRERESKRSILDRHIEWLRQLMEKAVADGDLDHARAVQKQIAEVRGVRNRMGK
jgi:ATP-dependent Clp protease ATP-binding subunit ClpC